jgi:hypothetical protein
MKYKVTMSFERIQEISVEAESPEQAREIVLSGEFEDKQIGLTIDENAEVNSVEEVNQKELFKEETKPVSLWQENKFQFPRLIEEADAAGAFTPDILTLMSDSMDLEVDRIQELIERARDEFEQIKSNL